MLRSTEALVRDFDLPRPQNTDIMTWRPEIREIGLQPNSYRFHSIRKLMLLYSSLPWCASDCVNRGFMRPEFYMIWALYLSPLDLRPIFSLIQFIAMR